jgi:hypothetical protein
MLLLSSGLSINFKKNEHFFFISIALAIIKNPYKKTHSSGFVQPHFIHHPFRVNSLTFYIDLGMFNMIGLKRKELTHAQ